MAVRLSVIMVHTARPNRIAGWSAEDLVGQLIGLPGIDLALVAPFANLAPTSTDRLQLESISGDVAVLDWQSPTEIIDSLREISFTGSRAPHPHDSDATTAGAEQRRIYAIDLTQFAKPDDVLAALQRLRQDRQVRTFTLGLGEHPTKPSSVPAATRNSAAAPQPKMSPAEDRRLPVEAKTASRQDRPTLDLDHLLDELDQLDP